MNETEQYRLPRLLHRTLPVLRRWPGVTIGEAEGLVAAIDAELALYRTPDGFKLGATPMPAFQTPRRHPKTP